MSPSQSSPRDCPLCDSAARFLFAKHAIGILECRRCKHQFADFGADDEHVSRTYDDNYFEGGGAGYMDYVTEGPLRIRLGRRYAKMLRRFTVPGYMLDVGAAAGFVLSGFRDEGWQGEGIEPNAKMAEFAQQQLGLTVHSCTLDQFQPKRHFDLVTLIQVLPHFADAPECVDRVSRMLRSSGLCLVESWNRNSWTARLAGRSWHEYSPPSVLHFFDKTSIRDLMQRHGLEIVASGWGRKWISAANGKSLLRHTLAASRVGKVAVQSAEFLPDRLALPYLGDDLIWMLFQKCN